MSERECLVIVVQLKAAVELFLVLIAVFDGMGFGWIVLDWGGLLLLRFMYHGLMAPERGVQGVNGIGLHLINCDLCAALRLICDIC